MFFPESEVIAREHQDLFDVVEEVDARLSEMFSPAPLRPGDLASLIDADCNQVEGVLDLFVEQGVLFKAEMVECEHCQNLMSADAFQEAIEDEDDFECSICEHPFESDAKRIFVYRMTARSLARPKPCEDDAKKVLDDLARVECVFRRRGQMWVLKFQGETVFMQDSRGLFYIARLLAEPGRDIPAVMLLAAAEGIDTRITGGTSGPVLDDQARAEYGKRFRELQEELEDAKRHNDLGHIDRLQSEMEALGAEIGRATGLGGRKRERTDAEKVRKSVSMAVSRAIDSIEREHKTLAHHLRISISSGFSFKYAPERPIEWVT
ncbi:hypothetical protein JCM19992_21790 [Thermostilla marina]